QQRAHHRVFGLIGLNEGRARLVAATRSARYLRKQLKRALRGARIATSEPQIRIDDADKRQMREVMPLCDELRADDNIERPFCDLIEFAAQSLSPPEKVGGKHENARIREKLRALLRDALDAGPARGECVFGLALRTDIRPLLEVTAVMAYQRTAKTMLDEPGVTLPAAKSVSAAAAERERRIAAAIEKQESLLAARQSFADRKREPRRKPTARSRTFRAHVDRISAREKSPASASAQTQMPIAPPLGVDARFDRGCCRGQHDRHAFDPRPHDRHVARVVTGTVLLFVGAVVLLVDDDESELRKGQEQGRTRADDHLDLARRATAPDARALSFGDRGMPFRRLAPKTFSEALKELAC